MPCRSRGTRPKITARQKRALIKDERHATSEYRRLGFRNLSRDEANHARFLRKQPVRRAK